ncbi:RICIN domain-containing protein [Catenulispora subtropica]|uniref:Ricin B lectin domain-containing protein n=1 Tax=Catenulispora subtropica TaxID=450798 RepID=A0ABN2SLR2_9ACTN
MSQTKTRRARTRRVIGAAAALAATAGLVATSAGSASADTNFTIHITPNSSFGLLLDVNGASQSPGAGVIQWYANGGANQVWSFYSFGGNTYEIVNGNSGQCLTTDGVAGDPVVQLPCNGGLGQRWTTGLNPSSVSAWTIANPWSGLYLDVNGASPWAGASIDVWYYNGGSNQYFAAL